MSTALLPHRLALLLQEAEAPRSALAQLAWPDLVGLGLVGLFVLLGLLRGLWWQVIRLVGLAGAGLLARALAQRFAPAFADLSGLSAGVAHGMVWLALFVLGLVLASLLGMIGKKSLEAMKLGLADRLGGALAGALTAAILHAALLVALAKLGPQPWTANALEGSHSAALLRTVTTRLPVLLDSEAADELRAWLGTGGEEAPAPEGSS